MRLLFPLPSFVFLSFVFRQLLPPAIDGLLGGLMTAAGSIEGCVGLSDDPLAFLSCLLNFLLASERSDFFPPPATFGSAAVFVNFPVEPAGRRSTTPGAAIVAFTTSGSSVTFANPCLKMSGSDFQASAAAFMDGAATARSKKPIDV